MRNFNKVAAELAVKLVIENRLYCQTEMEAFGVSRILAEAKSIHDFLVGDSIDFLPGIALAELEDDVKNV